VDALQLGSALRTVRLRLGLRQVAVARRAGVSQVVVSRLERGRAASMRLRTVLTVAEALEASVNLGLRWRGGELPRILNAGHAAIRCPAGSATCIEPAPRQRPVLTVWRRLPGGGKPSSACYQSLTD
jgi:transcriptional regulator with XRE-family HTH domain